MHKCVLVCKCFLTKVWHMLLATSCNLLSANVIVHLKVSDTSNIHDTHATSTMLSPWMWQIQFRTMNIMCARWAIMNIHVSHLYLAAFISPWALDYLLVFKICTNNTWKPCAKWRFVTFLRILHIDITNFKIGLSHGISWMYIYLCSFASLIFHDCMNTWLQNILGGPH